MEQPEGTKRKRDSEQPPIVCIAHVKGLSYGDLHLLSGLKDSEKKLAKLQEVRNRRLAQLPESPHMMKDTCDLVPEFLAEHHGIHWECYKRFTMNLDRLNPSTAGTSQRTGATTQRMGRTSSGDKIIFQPDCIFCSSESRKKVKVHGSWTTQGMSQFEYDGWKAVLEMAEMKQDEQLLVRIRGHDLFASEAKFHKTCRMKYMQKPEKWRSIDEEAQHHQGELEEAHRQAFDVVCDAIERDVLMAKKIMKLSDLRQMYVTSLQTSKYANPDYRGSKLKLKLEKHEPFRERLSFCDMGKSYIIFSTAIDVQTAVKEAFQLGSRDMIESAGSHLRLSILDDFSNAPELKWPPGPSDLTQMDDVVPDALRKLLCCIITGTTSSMSPRRQRLVQSIGQDICRAATNGSWKLPKHIIMCMSLRHQYRSEKLITLLNRMGHCESYSFSLELETALAEAVMKSSTQLSNQIIRSPREPSVFHSEFDNFDSLVNDLTGKGSVHTAHGIMMQEVSDDHAGSCPAKPTQLKTKQRSLQLTEATILPDCYVTTRKSPKLQVKQLQYPGSVEATGTSIKLRSLWIMIRLKAETQQKVPGWTGFISETGERPTKLTTIDYYQVINQPITEYKTVQECLRAAEEATREVGQSYVITTFDLGVCMKAFPLVWNSPDKYKSHIILIGTFHLVCAYMKMMGKKMAGSGLSDILLEAGLIGSGSLTGVLSGKHYDRALHCHKLMLECLERLLLAEYLNETNADDLFSSLPDDSTRRLQDLVESPSHVTLEAVSTDELIMKIVEDYDAFRQSVERDV